MIKKVTIVLVVLLLIAGIWAGLSYMGILSGSSSDGGGKTNRSGWSYVIEDGAATLTKYNGRDSSPEIPSEIEGVPVIAMGDEVFAQNKRINSVVIPDTITTLGNGIFENCTELSIVTLPAALERIPSKAFAGCNAIKVIQIPYGVKTIGSSAFNGCTSLSFVEIPDSVTTIGSEAFQNCSGLSEMSISRNLNNLGSHAFQGTPWLMKQSDEFVTVGNRILIKYNGISEFVEVPLGVTQITDAFEDNIFPLEIVLPDSLTSIGGRAFSGARALEMINIPDRVRSIGEAAFRGCGHLASIDLPDSVHSIGASAFQSCSTLGRMILPEGITNLPSLAFANCEKLRLLQIPQSAETIEDNIISYSGISDLRVYKGSAGEAFAIRNGYPYSYMQQSSEDFVFQQTEEGVQAVLYTGNIYDVVVPQFFNGEPITSLSDILFQHNYTVRSVELPESINAIPAYCFSDMNELRTVKLPEGLTSIGTGAFMSDPMLSNLIIPETVNYISDDAFVGCPSLVILAPVDSYAFEWASQRGIRAKDNTSASSQDFVFVQPYGQVLIAGYEGDETAPELPRNDEYGDMVQGIADSAFFGEDLTSISIPEGYESIGSKSFAENSVPMEISIPRSVTSIANDCFEGTEVTINGYNGSYAEEYARSHKIKFLIIYEWDLGL